LLTSRILGYRDQHLAEVSPDAIRPQLVAILTHHRPHVVVTYDPQGGHGHDDHVAIPRFTTDAISAASDARWYRGDDVPHQVQRLLWTPPVLAWDDPPPPRMEAEPGIDFLLDISAQKSVKLAALRAPHAASVDRTVDSRQAEGRSDPRARNLPSGLGPADRLPAGGRHPRRSRYRLSVTRLLNARNLWSAGNSFRVIGWVSGPRRR
jgi:LmbE family N-acetylglucosaminyl deacetylase